MLNTGTRYRKKISAAITYFEKASKLENISAQYMLGEIYLETDSEPENVKKAWQGLCKADFYPQRMSVRMSCCFAK